MTLPYFKGLVSGALRRLTTTFGEDVRISAKDGRFPDITVKGVYDDNFIYVDPETETLVSSNEPMIGIRMRDFSKPLLAGDGIYIFTERLFYKVIDVLEDGQGGAVLRIHLDGSRNEQTT